MPAEEDTEKDLDGDTEDHKKYKTEEDLEDGVQGDTEALHIVCRRPAAKK